MGMNKERISREKYGSVVGCKPCGSSVWGAFMV